MAAQSETSLLARDFPFSTDIVVRFRDVDAMGHVNNAVYFTYLETARIQLLTRCFGLKELKDVPVILGEAKCRFLTPAYHGETLTVGLGITRLGTKSFDIGYLIGAQDNRQIALARTTLIMFDYNSGVSVVIPDGFRKLVRELQAGWVAPDFLNQV